MRLGEKRGCSKGDEGRRSRNWEKERNEELCRRTTIRGKQEAGGEHFGCPVRLPTGPFYAVIGGVECHPASILNSEPDRLCVET